MSKIFRHRRDRNRQAFFLEAEKVCSILGPQMYLLVVLHACMLGEQNKE